MKLTVVHDGFEPGSAVLQGVSGGWPAVISALKTLVETGSPMPSVMSGGLTASLRTLTEPRGQRRLR